MKRCGLRMRAYVGEFSGSSAHEQPLAGHVLGKIADRLVLHTI
jgi:hypothetical protein